MSFSEDLFFEIFNRTFLTLKTLHLNWEGHYVSPDKINRIKTAQAKVAEGCIKSSQK